LIIKMKIRNKTIYISPQDKENERYQQIASFNTSRKDRRQIELQQLS
jgi:hypothetical protein